MIFFLHKDISVTKHLAKAEEIIKMKGKMFLSLLHKLQNLRVDSSVL